LSTVFVSLFSVVVFSMTEAVSFFSSVFVFEESVYFFVTVFDFTDAVFVLSFA